MAAGFHADKRKKTAGLSIKINQRSHPRKPDCRQQIPPSPCREHPWMSGKKWPASKNAGHLELHGYGRHHGKDERLKTGLIPGDSTEIVASLAPLRRRARQNKLLSRFRPPNWRKESASSRGKKLSSPRHHSPSGVPAPSESGTGTFAVSTEGTSSTSETGMRRKKMYPAPCSPS